jgi:NTP pyrophosphatase (non-canonical NTP hydrolase)
MTGNEYQELVARTINKGLTFEEQKFHALHGMVGEIGEIHSIYQKMYQGHAFEVDHVKKEFGDLLWFIAEYCTAKGWSLDDIMRMNIDKLKERYPRWIQSRAVITQKSRRYLMDFLIMVIAFYLVVGLFITYAALKDDQFAESIFKLGFLAKIFVMIGCILSAPIILINVFMSDGKK